MEDIYNKEIKRLEKNTWKIKYNNKMDTARLINENGDEMDHTTFGICLEALKNTYYDMNEKRYGESNKEPLDEFTKKRFRIQDYQLMMDKEIGEDIRKVFEIYSDDNEIFTLDNYYIYKNRKVYDGGFRAYLNRYETEKVLQSLEAFVNRIKERNEG